MARDKELSTFTSHGICVGVGYEMPLNFMGVIDRGSVNLVYDHLMFSYDDFRDVSLPGTVAGAEPFYDFSADVVQVFFSAWFGAAGRD